MSDVGKFIGLLISSSQQAHVFHFTTHSKKIYNLMGVYYQDIIDLIDEYADTYIKKSKRRIRGLNPYINKKIVTDPILIKPYFVNLFKSLRSLKLPKDPRLYDMYKEIMEVIYEVVRQLNVILSTR